MCLKYNLDSYVLLQDLDKFIFKSIEIYYSTFWKHKENRRGPKMKINFKEQYKGQWGWSNQQTKVVGN